MDFDEKSLMSLLLGNDSRQNLAKAINASLDFCNKFSRVAPKCEATTDELRQVVEKLLQEDDDHLFEDIIFHPNMPADALFMLLENDRYITALGHRSGPKELLEQLVEKHRYSEAITTLALYYYGKDDFSTEEFIEFVKKYKDDYMLRYNLVRSKNLSPEKMDWVRTAFGEKP